MSFRAKRELLAQVAPRYREATTAQKTIILNEFLAVTGYDRKYAVRLLAKPVPVPGPIHRPRAPRYGRAVQEALEIAWAALNGICGKRLVPFLPELVPVLERHGHLALTPEVRELLLALSPATADRLLKAVRQPHGLSTTKPGRLIKKQVPVRTFADWDDVRPGFLEADLVAHCGGTVEGVYLHTLTLTDVATAWTECVPLRSRSQHAVVAALDHARQRLPFPLLGLDTDNGSEFLNGELLAYCVRHQVTFTRGRTANKNDQCFVEQKNGSVVRHLVGYDRFEGEAAYQQLGQLYRAVRLYVNFFQPSLKLARKHRDGAKVSRGYAPARTPYQQLLATETLPAITRAHLAALYAPLDPVQLLRQIQMLQDALWRHAVYGRASASPAPVVSPPPPVVFAHTTELGKTPPPREALPTPRGTQRRTPRKPLGPRLYRTRVDPFAAVWREVQGWLAEHPERTARSLFIQLQAQYPGTYAPGQLRTLQHRVQAWRRELILTYDSPWLSEDPLVQPPRAGTLLGVALNTLDQAVEQTGATWLAVSQVAHQDCG